MSVDGLLRIRWKKEIKEEKRLVKVSLHMEFRASKRHPF